MRSVWRLSPQTPSVQETNVTGSLSSSSRTLFKTRRISLCALCAQGLFSFSTASRSSAVKRSKCVVILQLIFRPLCALYCAQGRLILLPYSPLFTAFSSSSFVLLPLLSERKRQCAQNASSFSRSFSGLFLPAHYCAYRHLILLPIFSSLYPRPLSFSFPFPSPFSPFPSPLALSCTLQASTLKTGRVHIENGRVHIDPAKRGCGVCFDPIQLERGFGADYKTAMAVLDELTLKHPQQVSPVFVPSSNPPPSKNGPEGC